MSLQLQPLLPVPDDTARVARAAFPHGNTFLLLRDELGPIFSDADFASLYPTRGQPAAAPWRLALVTVWQFVENLSDRQAADAVRARIDWKYALALDLTNPGFDSTVLSEFRTRLLAGSAEQCLLDAILKQCRQRGWLKARGQQRTDSTHVLARIHALNRLECVRETLRAALNTLAVVLPSWLLAHSPPAWLDRYGRRLDDTHLPSAPAERLAYACQVGRDGEALLTALDAPQAPSWLREIPAVQTLRRVWIQQFYQEAGQLRWRTEAEGIPPANLLINSPYDIEARYAKKRTTSWVGYKVHLSETCDEDAPHLISHVETTPAPVADGAVTAQIHHDLQEQDLLPAKHLVDTGYVEAELLLSSQRDYGVDLVGPARADHAWQAQAGEGFAASAFTIDWDHQQAHCPEGKTSSSWTTAVDHGDNEVIKIKFAQKDCQACPRRGQCTKAQRRTVTVRPQEQYEALQKAREREKSVQFKKEYGKRAGIEGTISQAVRGYGMRQGRYLGEAKTHLQNIATGAAINVQRISNWLMDRPREQTRTSSFAKLFATQMAA